MPINTSPGEFIKEIILPDYNLSLRGLALAINSPYATLHDFVSGKRKLSLRLAIRLSKFCKTTVQFWFNLEQHYLNGKKEAK